MEQKKATDVLLSRLCAVDFVESLPNKSLTNDIILSAKTLQSETESFSFQLWDSYCHVNDVVTYQLNKKTPDNWYVFMKYL